MFVDGSNMLIEMFASVGATHKADRPSDAAINLAKAILAKASAPFSRDHEIGSMRLVRRYWFGSVQGSSDDLESRRTTLHRAGFDATLFHKVKGRDEKGVDLAVAREMLIQAFFKNYEVAHLVAGDEDYVGLVQDLKRLGVVVVGMFYESAALSPKLRLAFDYFQPLQSLEHEQPELVRLVRESPGVA